MPEILILADDLSGAADCAGGCAAEGWDTLVLLQAMSCSHATATVLAVDLGSRDGPADRAGLALTTAMRLGRNADTKTLYHKIDSTLRGNWAHELAAALTAIAAATGAAPLAVIAPAFPARGRITRNGRVLVRAPGPQAAGANGEKDAGEIALPLRQLGISARLLDRRALNAPAHRLAEQMHETARAGVAALICDAETEQDLAAIAAAGLAAPLVSLWVGSAGLMRELARQLRHERSAPRTAGVAGGPILFVVGSAAAASRAQFDALAALPGLVSLRVAAGDLQDPYLLATQRRIAAELDAALRRRLDAAVLLAPGEGVAGPLDARLVARLAHSIGESLDGFAALIVTGGETARHVLERAGIWGLRLEGEVEVGVPWGIGLGSRSLAVVTKAGGFGDWETLVRCRAALREIAT